MTGAALLALLALCYGRVSLVQAALKEITASCAKGQEQPHEVIEPTLVTVTCPTGGDQNYTLTPAKKPQVYTGANEQGEKAVAEVVPGAAFTADEARKLRLSQIPKTEKSIYFHCKTADELHKCNIHIKVGPASLLGPNVCAAEGTEIDFKIERPSERVQFSCGEDFKLHPQAADEAFDAACAQTIKLPEIFARQGDKDGSEFRVQHLPKTQQEICYVCAQGDPQKSKKCGVRILVHGGGQEGSAKSLGSGARAAAALAFALVAASFYA